MKRRRPPRRARAVRCVDSRRPRKGRPRTTRLVARRRREGRGAQSPAQIDILVEGQPPSRYRDVGQGVPANEKQASEQNRTSPVSSRCPARLHRIECRSPIAKRSIAAPLLQDLGLVPSMSFGTTRRSPDRCRTSARGGETPARARRRRGEHTCVCRASFRAGRRRRRTPHFGTRTMVAAADFCPLGSEPRRRQR